jgi:hypothetical protein
LSIQFTQFLVVSRYTEPCGSVWVASSWSTLLKKGRMIDTLIQMRDVP